MKWMEKNGNKYLIFNSEIKIEIGAINGIKERFQAYATSSIVSLASFDKRFNFSIFLCNFLYYISMKLEVEY